MSNTHLPNGWTKARIGEYLYLKNGFAFKSSDYCNKGEKTSPVIRISDIDGTAATTESAVHVIASEKARDFIISKGDLLVAMSGATTGKFGIYNNDELAYQNQRIGNIKLISDSNGSTKFRNHLIAFISAKILEIACGGAQPNISGKTIESILIELPPLAEQKEIATLLDNLLAQVDTLKTRLDAIPNILKRFRQSVLAAAVSGKLTEEWRTENAKHEWEYKTIGDVCALATGKTPSRSESSYWDNGTVPWLTSAATGDAFTVYAKEYITALAASECQLKIDIIYK